ncbi:MAG: hypothetical protein SCABRO_00689 [Candidatus Scalindua brodae]|uniref:Uncharacterized protein n=1 Tax=Candidatus Scalindua brodae TaxID=237368 RepID=A0A0B0ELS1_9BACT|nr:MAG: hypothetical protein SCABRO_00689 [Candidatus Scalindua brodae]
MLKLSEVLQNSKLTKSNIIQKLKEMDEINKQVNEYLDEKTKSNN